MTAKAEQRSRRILAFFRRSALWLAASLAFSMPWLFPDRLEELSQGVVESGVRAVDLSQPPEQGTPALFSYSLEGVAAADAAGAGLDPTKPYHALDLTLRPEHRLQRRPAAYAINTEVLAPHQYGPFRSHARSPPRGTQFA